MISKSYELSSVIPRQDHNSRGDAQHSIDRGYAKFLSSDQVKAN